jgi:hypothetical protein
VDLRVYGNTTATAARKFIHLPEYMFRMLSSQKMDPSKNLSLYWTNVRGAPPTYRGHATGNDADSVWISDLQNAPAETGTDKRARDELIKAVINLANSGSLLWYLTVYGVPNDVALSAAAAARVVDWNFVKQLVGPINNIRDGNMSADNIRNYLRVTEVLFFANARPGTDFGIEGELWPNRLRLSLSPDRVMVTLKPAGTDARRTPLKMPAFFNELLAQSGTSLEVRAGPTLLDLSATMVKFKNHIPPSRNKTKRGSNNYAFLMHPSKFPSPDQIKNASLLAQIKPEELKNRSDILTYANRVLFALNAYDRRADISSTTSNSANLFNVYASSTKPTASFTLGLLVSLCRRP